MSPLTLEWVEKAEADFAAACALARRRKVPLPDQVCFHCQQAVEKYLKARLTEGGIAFPKTHDVNFLLRLALAAEPLWQAWCPALAPLNDYGVAVRYPGEQSTVQEAVDALRICKKLRNTVRQSLGLNP